ncbi:MAG TPA: hypothetical protein DIT25_00395 [Candidatus Moranbacteria bacterium]|nr:hypothetical protein [Candidatus Moranbacteria bacterium]
MKIVKGITLYECEVCGARYKTKGEALACGNKPAPKYAFKKGDMVVIYSCEKVYITELTLSKRYHLPRYSAKAINAEYHFSNLKENNMTATAIISKK